MADETELQEEQQEWEFIPEHVYLSVACEVYHVAESINACTEYEEAVKARLKRRSLFIIDKITKGIYNDFKG